MYKELLKLKQIRGMTEQIKQRITKAWLCGLITDEGYQILMEVKLSDTQSIEVS